MVIALIRLNNINKYWTDGCFIQVCNETDADKLHYYCGDHSAVKSTTNSGYYESKWGRLAVVRHTKTGVPYGDPYNSVNYYASTKISGAISNLCTGNRVFNVKAITNATYSWTCSSSLLPVSGSTSSQFTVQRNGNANGNAWVSVQITTACSASPVTTTQDFIIDPPISVTGYYSSAGNTIALEQDEYNSNLIYPGGQFVDLTFPPDQNATWSLVHGNPSSWYWNSRYNQLFIYMPNNNDYALFKMNLANACSSTDFYFSFLTSLGANYRILQNPTNNLLTIISNNTQTLKGSNAQAADQDIRAITITDKMGNILQQLSYAVGKTRIEINIANLKPDTYFINISNSKTSKTLRFTKQ